MKTIPVFFVLTRETDSQFRRKLALQATLIASAVVFLVAIIGFRTLNNWSVSPNAVLIALGIFLFISAFNVVSGTRQAKLPIQQPKGDTLSLAISPLATPVIVTPYGILAILLFMFLAQSNEANGPGVGAILGLLALIMALNYLGMLFADKIMRVVNIAILQLVGWVFAVLQSTLAIEAILRALQNLGVFKQI